MTKPAKSRSRRAVPTSRDRLIVAASAAYVATALLVDTLATRRVEFVIEWGKLEWYHSSGADLLKFALWFAIPFAFLLRGMDLRYFTFARWRKIDWYLLAAVAGIGAAVMIALPSIPGVAEYYRGWGGQSFDARIGHAARALVWTASWLTGWEFMFRYFLPRAFARLERHGTKIALAIIPMLEGLYHVIQQKPFFECLGMAALSFVLTAWTMRRRNSLLPFLGHLIIEIELIAYLFFTK